MISLTTPTRDANPLLLLDSIDDEPTKPNFNLHRLSLKAFIIKGSTSTYCYSLVMLFRHIKALTGE